MSVRPVPAFTRLHAACIHCVLAGMLGACDSVAEPVNSCALDVLGCGEALNFEIDERCELDEPLRVAVGHGTDAFVEFEPGERPELERLGGGQGALQQHTSLAVRVGNPDPAHSLFQVALTWEQLATSGTVDGAVAQAGSTWDPLDSRRLILGESNMHSGPDGSLEQWGLVLVLECPDCGAGDSRLRVTVRDSCDRRGEADHAFSWQ